jgi:hypothetical protein
LARELSQVELITIRLVRVPGSSENLLRLFGNECFESLILILGKNSTGSDAQEHSAKRKNTIADSRGLIAYITFERLTGPWFGYLD